MKRRSLYMVGGGQLAPARFFPKRFDYAIARCINRNCSVIGNVGIVK